MGKFDLYKIPLKSVATGTQEFAYVLDDKFFADIDGEELKKGNINVKVFLKKITGAFELSFELEGIAKVPCDRCLDDVEIPVECKEKLFIKFGKTYSEEGENIIIIPEEEGEVYIAWFLYEFVVLSLPMKRIHPPGKCNKAVSAKLKRHSASGSGEEDIETEGTSIDLPDVIEDSEESNHTDPRWDKLKDINFE